MTIATATRPSARPRHTTAPLRTSPATLRRPAQSFQWDLRIDESDAAIQDIEASLLSRPQRNTARSSATSHLPELPDAETWAKALTRGIIEVLLGLRPIGQLRRWVVYPLFKRLEERQQVCTGTAPHCWVRTVHSTQISHSIVELALTVSIDQQVIAVAMRLEACRYHWMATALDIV